MSHFKRSAFFKVMVHTPEEARGLARAISRTFPGARISGAIMLSDRKEGHAHEYEAFCFLIVPYELNADGLAVPANDEAILAFKQRWGP